MTQETLNLVFHPHTDNAYYGPFTTSSNILLGNLSRIWEEISEESDQYFVNWKFPFEQWSGDKGYMKLGVFYDQVDRTFDQDSFGNYRETGRGPYSYFGRFLG